MAAFRKPGFKDLDRDRQEQIQERLESLIEAGELLVPYDRELDKLLDKAREAPTRNTPAAQRGPPPRRPDRGTIRTDNPASCLYIEWRPVIMNKNIHRGNHLLNGVRGTITNVGSRPIKNITLRIAVRFPGFEDECVVQVPDAALEPGQTATWRAGDIHEYLPNPRALEIGVQVYSARFSE
jgi:hypothetical protein